MDVLRRSARKSRVERIKNKHIKEIMGVKGKLDIIDIIEKTTMVWLHQKDARGQNTKINYGIDTRGEKKNRTSKKNVDGMGSKKFTTRSMEKQGGMAFGFWKTATAVIKPDR
jgi:hypothetical protein